MCGYVTRDGRDGKTAEAWYGDGDGGGGGGKGGDGTEQDGEGDGMVRRRWWRRRWDGEEMGW